MPEHPADAIGTDTLRFADEYVDQLLEGEKRVTIRYDFEREYNWGHQIRFVNESGDAFAVGAVRLCETQTVAETTPIEGPGYENYDDPEALAADLQAHYPDAEIDADTEVTVIAFDPVRRLWACGYCDNDEFMSIMGSLEPQCPQCNSTDVEAMA